MTTKDKTVFITGAGRGIGRAIVSEALNRGARRVYGAARSPDAVQHDPRVVALAVDVTSGESVAAAARAAGDTDILINNAGILTHGSLLALTEADLRRDMDTNFYGTLRVIRAFVPILSDRPDTAIVNLLSIAAFAGTPQFALYSASKAALHSATQALRWELRPHGISVYGVFPGPVDTEMAEGVNYPKATPEAVARSIFDGIEAGTDDIFPDAAAQAIGSQWLHDPRAAEITLGSF